MYVWDINLNLELRYSVDQIIFEIFLQDMQKSHEEECDCARNKKIIFRVDIKTSTAAYCLTSYLRNFSNIKSNKILLNRRLNTKQTFLIFALNDCSYRELLAFPTL